MRRLITIALIIMALTPATALAKVYSKAETRAVIREAAAFYHVPSRWLQNAAIDIIYDGAHESGGDEKARNGNCVGILQFYHNEAKHPHNCGWHPTGKTKSLAKKHGHPLSKWRECGICSLYRFTKSYQQGGASAIQQHWAATLGR